MTGSALPEGVAALVDQVRNGRLPSPERRKEIRVRAGVSARALARALGVDVMTVVRWEDGATPRPEHAGPYRQALEALEEAVATS